VIPAYIATDLIFALAFAFLFVKAGAALGGGVKGGVILGVIVAVLSPVIGTLYEYYSVTYLPGSVELASAIFQVIAHAVEGAVAGSIYGGRRSEGVSRLPSLGISPGVASALSIWRFASPPGTMRNEPESHSWGHPAVFSTSRPSQDL
jgi:hypothetical protein